jgi:hypothetical protein
MREQMPVICPTSQAKMPAADWHDGQISARAKIPPSAKHAFAIADCLRHG